MLDFVVDEIIVLISFRSFVFLFLLLYTSPSSASQRILLAEEKLSLIPLKAVSPICIMLTKNCPVITDNDAPRVLFCFKFDRMHPETKTYTNTSQNQVTKNALIALL